MQKYLVTGTLARKITVIAEQLSPENVQTLAEWTHGMVIEEIDAVQHSQRYVALNVPTYAGNRRASEGDYIVQGSNGDFAVFPKDLFALTFTKSDS